MGRAQDVKIWRIKTGQTAILLPSFPPQFSD